MRGWLLGATVGMALAAISPFALNPSWLIGAGALAVIGLVVPRCYLLTAVAFGFGWSALSLDLRTSKWIPASWEGQDLAVTGWVVGLPRIDERSQRFVFKADWIDRKDIRHGKPRLLLSWYGEDRIQPGQEWHFTVRLNRPRGQANPGGFNYEAWLIQKDIAATGYVRPSGDNRLLSSSAWISINHRLRYWLRDKIDELDMVNSASVLALLIGESAQLSAGQWTVLSNTGTNHLMIVSGLHVSLVAGLTLKLAQVVLGWVISRSMAVKLAALVSVLAAAAYGAIAGFGLPVQRALIMVTIVMFGYACGRNLPVSYHFCVALFLVLLLDPLAVRASGFWLSFAAVFFLLYAFVGRISIFDLQQKLRVGIKAQWVVFCGLAAFFTASAIDISLIAPIVNSIAIPWVSLVVVPVVLAAGVMLAFSQQLANILFQVADLSFTALWYVLKSLAELEVTWAAAGINLWLVPVLFVGSLMLLAPRGIPVRWLGLFALLPLMKPVPIERRGLEIAILDVGQGLASVIKTRRHVLVYDMGPRLSERYDSGASVVVPYLRQAGIERVNLAVVSHADNDHAGGAISVIQTMAVESVISGSPLLLDTALQGKKLVKSCSEKRSWVWDDVHLSLFQGDEHLRNSDNNRSCMLLVSYRGRRIFFPGDIQSDVETALIRQFRPDLDVLIAPHHGSRSSSSPAFLNALTPEHVIVSSRYRNRFNHPDPIVLRRYQVRDIEVLNTAYQGALTIRVNDDGELSIESHRQENPQFWY